MTKKHLKHASVLGLLSAIGPLSVDMYLPALPNIASDLGASAAAAQWTLMAFFLAMGMSQIVYGTASDILGRKIPIYFGLAVFILGSIGCCLATDASWLIACRVLQGIGAAAPMVIARAVVRDLHTGIQAARLMSTVMLVFSVCPILAPLFGSTVMIPFGWRAVFVAVAVIALIGVVLVMTVLPETKDREDRNSSGLAATLNGFRTLLSDGHFIGVVLIGGFGLSTFFVFVSGSSFVYIDHYGLSPMQYSFAFSINAVAFIGSSQFAATVGARIGMKKMVIRACAMFASIMLGLSATLASGIDGLPVVICGLFIANAFLGLVIPSAMVIALDDHGAISGMASALAGTLQMVTAGLVAVLATLVFNGTALPMVAMIAACGVVAFVLSVTTLKQQSA